jgi:hypothetical protein
MSWEIKKVADDRAHNKWKENTSIINNWKH